MQYATCINAAMPFRIIVFYSGDVTVLQCNIHKEQHNKKKTIDARTSIIEVLVAIVFFIYVFLYSLEI